MREPWRMQSVVQASSAGATSSSTAAQAANVWRRLVVGRMGEVYANFSDE